jgi:tetratricopeptide (TPR) repeat protein
MKKLLFLLATTSAGASLFGQMGQQLLIEQTTLNQMASKLWSDPSFVEAFIGSYAPLTTLEPEFNVNERNTIKEKVLPYFDPPEGVQPNPMGALPVLLELQREPGATAGVDLLIGNLYLQNGNMTMAEQALLSATRKHPNFRRAWKNLALIYATNGQYEKALIPLSKAISLGDTSDKNYGILGVVYMQKQDYLSAEFAFRYALMMDPKNEDWKINLFQTLLYQERFEEANALLKPMIAADPNNENLWLYQANVYLGLDKPLKAAEVLEIKDRMGSSGSSSDAQSLERLGTIYFNNQLYDVAYDVYKRALKSRGANFESMYNSTNALAAVGKFEESLDLISQLRVQFKSLVEKDNEKRLDLLVLEARCLRSLDEKDKAARILEKIVVEDPMNGRALIELGLYYKDLEVPDHQKAITMFEHAENVSDFAADAYIEHAKLLVQLKNYRDAVRLLRRAQDIRYNENVQSYLERVESAARRF